MPWRPPICRPFPHVAGHVVQAVAVGGERADRSGRAVALVVAPREVAVPVVRQSFVGPLPARRPTRTVRHPVRRVRRAPTPPRSAAACRPTWRRPRRPRRRRAPRDDRHGRRRSCRVRRDGSTSARRPRPPQAEVAEVDRPDRHPEHHRTRDEVLRRWRRESPPDRAAARPPCDSRSPPRMRRTPGW